MWQVTGKSNQPTNHLTSVTTVERRTMIAVAIIPAPRKPTFNDELLVSTESGMLLVRLGTLVREINKISNNNNRETATHQKRKKNNPQFCVREVWVDMEVSFLLSEKGQV